MTDPWASAIQVFLKCVDLMVLLDLDYIAGALHVYSFYLGGPLVRERDGTLIGVVHGMDNDDNQTKIDRKMHITLTKYTRIDHYFNWISNVTGISLPECGPSPPPPNKADVALVTRVLENQARRERRKQQKE